MISGPFQAYPTEFVTFNLLRLPSAESSFVDQIRELLLHKLFNTLYGLFETIFGRAGDVKIERRILHEDEL